MSNQVDPKSKSPIRKLMGVQVVGTGSFLPDNVVTNEDLSSLGCDPEWIIKRTGIRERRHAPPEMNTSDMAVAAAQRAMEAAEVKPEDIDLLVLGTFTPDRLMPATATLVQDRLGVNCGAMDLAAACSGFVYALVTGMQFVATGGSRRALVIGADTNSRILDPEDKKTYPLFGDGAGAVVLAPGSGEQGALSYTIGADGSGTDLLGRISGGVARPYDSRVSEDRSHFMQMQGRPIFKWAVRWIEDSSREMVAAAGMSLDDVDWWFFHQANVRILDAAVDSLGIERDKVVMHLQRYGNTSGASIPVALDETLRAGKISSGNQLLFAGFGGGLTWGSMVFRW